MTDRPRVLVLEDDDNVRISLVAFLEGSGYEVIEARTVEEARHAIASSSFAAAILDRYVGRSLGTDLIAGLREANAGIVVAVVSGDSSPVPAADINMTKSDSPSVLLRELSDRLGRP